MKTKEYDIRKRVVQNLIGWGFKREHIRFEIPLDTASANGRVDIVLLDNKLRAIELKSGKDKVDGLKEQVKGYREFFDAVGVVSCASHKEKIEDLSFWGNILYHCTEKNCIGSYEGWRDKEVTPLQKIAPHLFRQESRTCTSYKMAKLLWRCEIQEIFGAKTNVSKWDLVQKVREEISLKELRPKVIEQLKKRPLNRWEESFWGRYDGKTT